MRYARSALLVLCLIICIVRSLSAQPCSVVTIAGRQSGFSGDGGAALDARLFGAGSIAATPDGQIAVVDRVNRRIRAFTPGGTITTIAGSGAYGDSGDDGPATSATFKAPTSLAVDRSGNLFVADIEARRIRRISAAGIITHFAGTGIARYSGDDGPASAAGFAYIQSMATGPDGSLFVLDGGAKCVRRIGADGRIARYAGTRRRSSNLGARDPLDYTGPALEATFQDPGSIAVDSAGNLFVSDSFDNLVRKITPEGVISRFAGNSFMGSGPAGDGGPATAAPIKPGWIATDGDGVLYVQDTNGPARIRRILPSGPMDTFASVILSSGVAVDGALIGSQDDVVFRVAAAGNAERIAGVPVTGFNGDDRPALTATLGLNVNSGLVLRDDGAVLFADSNNSRVRAVLPNGTITTLAGGGTTLAADGIPATSASLLRPGGIGIDGLGRIYFTESLSNLIFRVDLDGTLRRIGGNGGYGLPTPFDDGKLATEVSFRAPRAIAVALNGDVYVIQNDAALRGIYKIQGSDGRLRAVPFRGVNLTSDFLGPISADSAGNIFVATADRATTLIRISPDSAISTITIPPLEPGLRYGHSIGPKNLIATSAWSLQLSTDPKTVMTLGRSAAFWEGSAEDGPVAESRLGTVGAVAFDKEGKLFFVDPPGQRIRRINAGCAVTAQPVVTAMVDGATLSGSNGLAPGSLTTLFGIGLGPAVGQGAKLDEQGRVSTELAGTRVFLDGVPAPLLYASDNQVNFVTPFSMEGRHSFNLQLEYNGVRSEPRPSRGVEASPGLFVLGKDTRGTLKFFNSDWTINSQLNPARKGSSVIAFASGFGQTIPAGIDGLPNQPPVARPLLPVEVKIDDTVVPVEYLGGAPGFVAGMMQINIGIPESLKSSGLCMIRITVADGGPGNDARTEAVVFVR